MRLAPARFGPGGLGLCFQCHMRRRRVVECCTLIRVYNTAGTRRGGLSDGRTTALPTAISSGKGNDYSSCLLVYKSSTLSVPLNPHRQPSFVSKFCRCCGSQVDLFHPALPFQQQVRLFLALFGFTTKTGPPSHLLGRCICCVSRLRRRSSNKLPSASALQASPSSDAATTLLRLAGRSCTRDPPDYYGLSFGVV
jgi:hypothetical protein